jgi:glycerol-3-phosphate dehydrogenase
VGAAPRSRLSTLDAPARLVAKYGTEAEEVAALDPTLLAPHLPVTAGEVEWAVRKEGALDADDVLHRRTRLGLVATNLETTQAKITTLVSTLASPTRTTPVSNAPDR